MALSEKLLNAAYRIAVIWLALCGIFTVTLALHMILQYNQSISDTIVAVFIVGTIGSAPFAILKFIKKEREKKLHGQIQ